MTVREHVEFEHLAAKLNSHGQCFDPHCSGCIYDLEVALDAVLDSLTSEPVIQQVVLELDPLGHKMTDQTVRTTLEAIQRVLAKPEKEK